MPTVIEKLTGAKAKGNGEAVDPMALLPSKDEMLGAASSEEAEAIAALNTAQGELPFATRAADAARQNYRRARARAAAGDKHAEADKARVQCEEAESALELAEGRVALALERHATARKARVAAQEAACAESKRKLTTAHAEAVNALALALARTIKANARLRAIMNAAECGFGWSTPEAKAHGYLVGLWPGWLRELVFDHESMLKRWEADAVAHGFQISLDMLARELPTEE